jgi:uncharacterized protein YecT (DUF1311 family)
MKKVAILFVLILGLSLPLSSIGHANYRSYDVGGEFTKWVENNPLDRDYQRDKNIPANYRTNNDMARIAWKYAQLWDRELNVIYQKLLLKLTDKEKELLIDSQVGWLQYHEKEHAFVNEISVTRIVGSHFRIQRIDAYLSRLRERTLDLMRYYNKLGGTAEFEYKGSDGEE